MTTFYNLAALNSATKYPSITTYHDLGPGGYLQESGNPFEGHNGPIYVTEKIDGTNGRIILTADGDWYIGSREDILTAEGDRVHNPALGIVDTLRPIASALANKGPWPPTGSVLVLYFEVYGSDKLPAWKTYGDGTRSQARLFDCMLFLESTLAMGIEHIALWRDYGGQAFYTVEERDAVASIGHLDQVPQLLTIPTGTDALPTIESMSLFMQLHAGKTQAAITPSQSIRPEGIVLRTADRSIIRKARYQSYDRTLGARKSGS